VTGALTSQQRHAAMLAAPKCGAKTRAGAPCKSPAVFGKKRCRMHGGANGSGAPKGNTNARKHGYYTKEQRAERKALRDVWRQVKQQLTSLRESAKKA
jgi:uncharacterized protein YjcR